MHPTKRHLGTRSLGDLSRWRAAPVAWFSNLLDGAEEIWGGELCADDVGIVPMADRSITRPPHARGSTRREPSQCLKDCGAAADGTGVGNDVISW